MPKPKPEPTPEETKEPKPKAETPEPRRFLEKMAQSLIRRFGGGFCSFRGNHQETTGRYIWELLILRKCSNLLIM